MKSITEFVSNLVRFLLAAFLWLHALFFLNFKPSLLDEPARLLHLSTYEVILLGLLLLFSLLAGSNSWKAFVSLAYIYFFPFVLLFYFGVYLFRLAAAAVRWFGGSTTDTRLNIRVARETLEDSPASSAGAANVGFRAAAAKTLDVSLRPFKSFTILWCLLLLFAVHVPIVWLALGVVLVHLARLALKAVRLMYFSKPWLAGAATYIRGTVDDSLSKLACVNRESPKTPDLQNLWTTLRGYRICAQYLLNSKAASKWASILFAAFLGAVYLYLAFVFSFAYYGLTRVYGVHFPWTEALTTSIFIPFYVSDLPKIFVLRFLGGLHCLLVVSIGVGGLIKYLRKRLEPVREVASFFDSRLSERELYEKYCILQDAFATPSANTTSTGGPPSQR
jgi:hypothetical protein